jgi:hypothetical protein
LEAGVEQSGRSPRSRSFLLLAKEVQLQGKSRHAAPLWGMWVQIPLPAPFIIHEGIFRDSVVLQCKVIYDFEDLISLLSSPSIVEIITILGNWSSKEQAGWPCEDLQMKKYRLVLIQTDKLFLQIRLDPIIRWSTIFFC